MGEAEPTGASEQVDVWVPLLSVGLAIAVFAVVTVVLIRRRDPGLRPLVVPAPWRHAGWMVWVSAWFSSRLPSSVEDALRDRFDPPVWVLPLGFAVGGLVLALVLWVGAGLLGYADPRAVRWAAAVFGWGAFTGLLYAVDYARDGAWDGMLLVGVILLWPVLGALALVRAVRTPVERVGDREAVAAP